MSERLPTHDLRDPGILEYWATGNLMSMDLSTMGAIARILFRP